MGPRLAAFLAGAVVTAACLPALAAEDPAADLVARGRALLAKGDHLAAKDAFLAAVAKDGKSLEARRGAAEALLGLGMSTEAVEQADAGLEATGNQDAGLWLLAARGYLQRGDRLPPDRREDIANAYADAKAKAAMALRQDPSLSLARAVLSRACRLTGEAERAAGVLKEGLEKAPKDFDLLFERGMLLASEKRHEAALADFTAACEADPRSGDAEYQRAMALAFLKRPDDCYAALVRAASLDPSNVKPLRHLCDWLKDRSVPRLREVLKARPDHAWAHAYLAWMLAQAKDAAGATKEMKDALALAPGDADLVAWGGQVDESLGLRDEAMVAFRRALQADPSNGRAWGRLLEIATNPGNATKADLRKEIIAFLEKVRPEDPDLWNNVGLLYRDSLKDYRKSLEAYLKAAALAPLDQGILNDTGLIYLYHGASIGEDRKKALPWFEKCLALVDDEGQSPLMGARDALENLAVYHMEVEPDPEKALAYAERRNHPEFLALLPRADAMPSGKASAVRAWAAEKLKK
jgi:tetratricopeptide (TPR) repeat protein